MKLRLDDLPKHLQQQFAPIYLVSGNDPLLSANATDSIRQKARALGFAERHVFHVDQHFKWDEFTQAANSLSLFSHKQLLEIRMPSGKPSDAGKQQLKAYAAQCPRDMVLLIITDKLPKPVENTLWFKAVLAAGVVIPVWPIPLKQLPHWIRQTLTTLQLDADPEGIEHIVNHTEGNLLACQQTLEKLRILNGPGTITAKTILQLLSDQAQFSIFDWVDCALQGETKRLLRIIHYLKNSGAELVLMSWALLKELRLLCQISEAHAQGQPLGELYQQHRVWDPRKGFIQLALQRHDPKGFQLLLYRASQLDKMVKGAHPMDPWAYLTQLSLCLAGALPVKRIAVT